MDITLDSHQQFFEVVILDPAKYDIDAFDDRISRFDKSHELLVEKDEIFVFDLLLEWKKGDFDLLPIPFDGQHTESLFLKTFPAFTVRGR
jgi:hypothetical protein